MPIESLVGIDKKLDKIIELLDEIAGQGRRIQYHMEGDR